MSAQFLGNIGTGKLHALGYTDGRCGIGKMRMEHRIEFETLEEALKYPNENDPILCKCAICFPKMEKEKEKQTTKFNL